MATEELIVLLDAKTQKLDAKLRATEKRLDGLDGKTKKTDKSFLSLEKAGRALGAGITAVASAGLAASAAITVATRAAVLYSKELKIASNRSGENVERLQSLAFATKTVGIDLNKLGDITKDTQERLGEFTKDGTGGFLDFVSVAGLTKEEAAGLAREFQHLTGTQVLQEMVTRMEEAGATTQEMSFALEGVASDTTDLIPLLVDGGKKLAVLESEFNDLKITLTQLDIDRISKLGIETAKLGEITRNSSAKAVSVLSEEITQITKMMADSAQDMAGLIVKAVTGYQVIVQEGAAWIANLFREAEITALQAQSFIVGIFGDNTEIEAAIAKLVESDALRDAFDVKFLEEKWAKAQASVAEYYGEIKEQEEELPAITLPGTPDGKEPEDLTGQALGTDEEIQAIEDRFKREETLLAEKLERELLLVGDNLRLRRDLADEFEDATQALEKKREQDQEKQEKKETKEEKKRYEFKLDQARGFISAASSLNGLLLGDNELIAKGLIVADTAAAIMKSLSINPYDYANVAVLAATGLTQLANVGSGNPSSGSAGGGNPSEARQQNFIPDVDTTSLELTDATDSGSNQQTVTFATDTGDELMDVIAKGLEKGRREGRF